MQTKCGIWSLNNVVYDDKIIPSFVWCPLQASYDLAFHGTLLDKRGREGLLLGVAGLAIVHTYLYNVMYILLIVK